MRIWLVFNTFYITRRSLSKGNISAFFCPTAYSLPATNVGIN